ncbi:hypothetical protein ABH926_004856 [Catenulispora sp. GP43]|uniref:hypothetical protein n=1 Tax=Catenulispora sp. GP43 TaxID=3156263 RepID=UPI0035142542
MDPNACLQAIRNAHQALPPLIGSFDEYGRIVFADAETTEAWIGDHVDSRAAGCTDCGLVHWDGDALVCCDTGQALPLVSNGHRWLQAPDDLVAEHLHQHAGNAKDSGRSTFPACRQTAE